MYEVAISHHITPKLSVFLGTRTIDTTTTTRICSDVGEKTNERTTRTFIVLCGDLSLNHSVYMFIS